MMKPLAPYGNSINTNHSRSISFSILDQNGDEIPTEIIIPRDPNLIIPKMILQNVTSFNKSFHMKLINIKSTNSIHFDIYPFNKNLSYLFIYKFDHLFSFHQLDGWTLLCHSSIFKFINLL
jgi:hypothetical protein